MLPTFLRAYPPTQPTPGSAYWLPFQGDEVLVQDHERGFKLIRGGEEIQAILKPQAIHYLGTLEGVPCLACEVGPEIVMPKEWHARVLRALYGQLDDPAYAVVGYASQLLHWHRISRYCPVCGRPTEAVAGTWGRHCPHCGYTSYPPVTPAVLALVYDGERVLLAHKPGWGKRYGCIAGFVEPGESLEECVQREVYEEVGVEVTDVTYAGSQPWPFPHQLMVGYTARYAGGTVHLDQQELDDAAWFHIDALPELPPPLSLAHRIIMKWVASQRSDSA